MSAPVLGPTRSASAPPAPPASVSTIEAIGAVRGPAAPSTTAGIVSNTASLLTDVMVVEEHAVFREGIVACLDGFEGIGWVEVAASATEAWAHPALGEAHVVLVDASMEGAVQFVRELRSFGAAVVVTLASRRETEQLGALIEAGSVTTLIRENLDAQRLGLGLRAAASGVLSTMADYACEVTAKIPTLAPQLSSREGEVLALVADGLTTREISERLHYSERTVKKVLGDVVVKLGARSRSQAIAYAVRRGII